jgi:hypothetical protein
VLTKKDGSDLIQPHKDETMRAYIHRILAAELVVAAASQLVGCSDTCSAHSSFCNDQECSVVWDCGEGTREFRATAGGCECIEGQSTSPGTCKADICTLLNQVQTAAIVEGDSAFDTFDDALNEACDWNVNTVEPLVIESGTCPTN